MCIVVTYKIKDCMDFFPLMSYLHGFYIGCTHSIISRALACLAFSEDNKITRSAANANQFI